MAAPHVVCFARRVVSTHAAIRGGASRGTVRFLPSRDEQQQFLMHHTGEPAPSPKNSSNSRHVEYIPRPQPLNFCTPPHIEH